LAAIEENENSDTANHFDGGDATGIAIGGSFFAGGEIGSYFRAYDLHSILATNFSVTGGNFITGDYHQEDKRSVKSWRLPAGVC
jgi:hypothetical protein